MISIAILRQFWPFIAIAALTASTWYYRTSLLTAEARLEAVEAIGKAQEERAKEQTKTDKLAKEKADRENAKTRRDLAAIYDAYGRLRDQSTRSSLVPPASPGADSSTVCFDRAGLAEAMGVLERGIPAITRKGDEAIADLNSARAWAQR